MRATPSTAGSSSRSPNARSDLNYRPSIAIPAPNASEPGFFVRPIRSSALLQESGLFGAGLNRASAGERPRHAEADVVVAPLGVGFGADRGAERGLGAEPVAAANGAARAGRIRMARAVARSCRHIIAVAILGPFPDIAEEIVEAEGVGREGADGRGKGISVPAVQVGRVSRQSGGLGRLIGAVGEFADFGGIAAETVARVVAAARGVFEFGFRQQSVGLAGGLRQPVDIGLGVLPAHADGRMVAVLDVARIEERAIVAHLRDILLEGEATTLRLVAGAVDEGGIQVAGNLKPADRDRLPDDGVVLRAFVRGRGAAVDI